MSKIYTSADQLIGKTPLLELSHIEKAEKLEAKLLAKLEYFNPAGSVKDRIAKAILDDAVLYRTGRYSWWFQGWLCGDDEQESAAAWHE